MLTIGNNTDNIIEGEMSKMRMYNYMGAGFWKQYRTKSRINTSNANNNAECKLVSKQLSTASSSITNSEGNDSSSIAEHVDSADQHAENTRSCSEDILEDDNVRKTKKDRDLTKYRRKIQLLKEDLKIMKRALVKEVGPDVNIQEIIKEPSSWKGRNEQIISLKAMVAKLELQLLDAIRSAADGRLYLENTKCKKSSRDGKKSEEKIKDKSESSSSESTKFQQEVDVLKSKNSTLNAEVKDLHGKISVLLQKSLQDDELVDMLTEQLAGLELRAEDAEHQKDETEKKLLLCIGELRNELEANKNLVIHLNKVITGKDEELRQLKDGSQNGNDCLVSNEQNENSTANTTVDSTVFHDLSKYKEVCALLESSEFERKVLFEHVIETQKQLINDVNHHLAKWLRSKNDQYASNSTNIEKEKNESLRAALNSVLEAKKADLLNFSKILEHSREVFSNTINELRES